MTIPEAQPNRRGRFSLVLALVVAAVLALLSAAVMVPPESMALFPLVIGASEMSPFLVLLDLLWCLAAFRLLRGRPNLRSATIVILVLSGIIAVRPLTRFTRAAADASRQLGTGALPPRFSLLDAVRGLPVHGDVTERAIHYTAADSSPLVMRTFAQPAHAVQPAVVVIYGGAWRGGDASQCANVSRSLASLGYVVIAIDYRHAPRNRFPAELDDIRRSLAVIRDSATAWRIDTRRIALLGRSSGGHLAELASYSPGDIPPRAVVAIYAPYDLVQGYTDLPSPDPIGVRQVLTDFIGGSPREFPVRYHSASPASFVHPGLPPTLILFGGRDHVVKPEFNRRATSDLRAAHVPVVSVELPWAEHGFDMAPAGLGAQLAFFTISEFLDRELRH